MLKLKRYLKPFVISLAAIILLLFVQAVSDLSLPGYMSDIVNVGIQQGGIENAVPKAIRETELDKIMLFLNEEEKAKVAENYTLLDVSSLFKDQADDYLDKYHGLVDGAVYELTTKDKNTITELNLILGKAILIVTGIEKSGGSIFLIPSAQIEAVKNLAKDNIAELTDSMITQSAVPYIHEEYTALGININKLQNNYILVTGGIMLLVALVSVAATIVVAYLSAKVAAGLSKNLRRDVFKKVTSFSNSEFDKFSTASLITRSTNDVQQIQLLLAMLLRIVFYAPILAIGGVIKVLNSDASMAWIIGIAVTAILSLVITMFVVAIPKFKKVQKLVDRLNQVTREILSGISVIRAFNNQKHEDKKFDAANIDLTKVNLFINRVMALMMPAMMLILNGVTLLIVWVGAHQVNAGAMQVGDMMAFIQYAMQIIMSFLMISIVSIMLPRAAVSAERIADVLVSDIAVKDAEDLQHFGSSMKDYVEFQNVSFRYPGAEESVLTDLSFTAKPGETTAFIGSTGSGKTTLINLIPRFYDATAGRILINGTDIKTVSQHELREKIGYIPQKAVLFSGTIESNLLYGVEGASIEDLAKSAQIAQATEFIEAKPEGFKAEIAQAGANVSGGQKQRLSIARALTKKPEIYIFDDSFSALDFKTDAELRKALKKETGQSIILIVAQRISTIMNAEQIIVLDEGKIVGKGTHKELMNNCDVYQEIALSQFSKEELA